MTDTACSQAGCPFGISGRCLEGFEPPSTCPYQVQQDARHYEASTFVQQNLVDLPSGEALTEKQAAEVTRDDFSNLIIIAGPFNSGKTTILTSLFEAFQEAPLGSFQFRGSRTLFGFERRCHLGRAESGAEEADTTHTSLREGVMFLHLALASIEDGEFRHSNLLLSDVSGELFRRLRDSSVAAREFLVIARADHICIVIDGEKISSRDGRHVARNDSRSILRSIVESGNLNNNCIIDIAFSKWDVVVEALDSADGLEVRDFIDTTRSILASVASNFEVRFHEIAARPSLSAKVPFAHGLPTLLRSWMSRFRPATDRQPIYAYASKDREFNRFTAAVVTRSNLEKVYNVERR